MKLTSDKKFADSNILLYLLGNDTRKKGIAKDLVASRPIISTQVLSENVNVINRKFKDISDKQLEQHIGLLASHCIVKPVNLATVQLALQVKSKYHYGWFDCTIIAAALLAECTILYTEDLHDGQIIEQRLTIVNPFKVE